MTGVLFPLLRIKEMKEEKKLYSTFLPLIHFVMLESNNCSSTWIRRTMFDGHPGVISKLKNILSSHLMKFLHQSLFSWAQGLDLVTRTLLLPSPSLE